MEEHNLKSVLSKNGYSLTDPRISIFKSLVGKEPQTLHELLKLNPKVDRASVYRTVELYEKLGIIHKINIGWKYKVELTDLFHRHHHHLICSNCQTIIPLAEDQILEDRIAGLAEKNGFSVQHHYLEIVGLCANCSTK